MKHIKKIGLFTLGLFLFSCSVNTEINIQTLDLPSDILIANKTADTIIPDGKRTFEWVVQFSDSDGKPLANTDVNFSVLPITPSTSWRDINYLAPQYGSNEARFREKVTKGEIRLLGTVNPIIAKTDNEGKVKTIYTVSNIGGNEETIGQEKIIAKASNITKEIILNTGYKNFVKITEIQGGLRISGATGRYVTPELQEILKNIGEKIRNESWKFPLTVTAGNLKWGGLYPPHFTHRNGLSADFRPMSTDGNGTWCQTDGTFASNYDKTKTLELIKIFKNSGADEIIFNDPDALSLGVKQLAGHHNHLHVGWSTTESEYAETLK